MRNLFQKRKESGFTIVEVMIVLAIAGLIILVVFLAVPALQRNSRNTQRNSDVSLIGAGVNECLNNRNSQTTSCDVWAGELDQYIDATKLRQLTTWQATTPSANQMAQYRIQFGARCDAAGSAATTTGANPRSAVILFNSENTTGTGVPRCQEI